MVCCCQDLGSMLSKLIQQGADPETENAGIPQEAAVLQIFPGGHLIGLFHETQYPAAALVIQRLTTLNVAEAGLCSSRRYTAGHQEIFMCQPYGMLQGAAESGVVLNQVVGCHHYQYGILTVTSCQGKRRMGYRGGGVASFRFEKIVGLVLTTNPGLCQLILAGKIMFAIGNGHYGTAAGYQGCSATVGFS